MARITSERLGQADAIIRECSKTKGTSFDEMVSEVATKVFLKPNMFQWLFGIKPKFSQHHTEAAHRAAGHCCLVLTSPKLRNDKDIKELLITGQHEEFERRTANKLNQQTIDEIEKTKGAVATAQVAQWKARGIDLNGDSVYPPLRAAIDKGDEDLVDALIEGGAEVTDIVVESALAHKNPSATIVKLLIAHGGQPPLKQGKPLPPIRDAIKEGLTLQRELFKKASLERDFDAFAAAFPGKSDTWLLYKAIAFNDVEAFQFITFSMGADTPFPTECPFPLPEGCDRANPALSLARYSGADAILKELEQFLVHDEPPPIHRPIPRNASRSTLQAAVLQCTVHDLENIIPRFKRLLNKQDNFGNTPLIEAVKLKDPKKVQLLVDAGAIIDIKNKEGLSAITIPSTPEIQEILFRGKT